MALVTIAEAAELVGKSRKTLYRAIKTGALSATTNVTGVTNIDIAELVRVYGPLRPKNVTSVTVSMSQDETANVTSPVAQIQAELAVLKAENTLLRERIHDKEKHIEHMAQAMRLLEHKQQAEKRPWWKFGRQD